MLKRGYIVNEFNEIVGCYNINGKNEYYVSIYHTNKGYMSENDLLNYVYGLGLYPRESKSVYNVAGKPYSER